MSDLCPVTDPRRDAVNLRDRLLRHTASISDARHRGRPRPGAATRGRAGKCKTWKMEDQIAGLENAR